MPVHTHVNSFVLVCTHVQPGPNDINKSGVRPPKQEPMRRLTMGQCGNMGIIRDAAYKELVDDSVEEGRAFNMASHTHRVYVQVRLWWSIIISITFAQTHRHVSIVCTQVSTDKMTNVLKMLNNMARSEDDDMLTTSSLDPETLGDFINESNAMLELDTGPSTSTAARSISTFCWLDFFADTADWKQDVKTLLLFFASNMTTFVLSGVLNSDPKTWVRRSII